MTPESFIERVSERLGTLTAEMADNRNDMAELKALIAASDQRSSEHRKGLYEAVDEIKRDVAQQANRLDTIAVDAKRGADVAAKVDRWEQQGKGILIAAGVGGASLAALAAVSFDTFITWLRARLGL